MNHSGLEFADRFSAFYGYNRERAIRIIGYNDKQLHDCTGAHGMIYYINPVILFGLYMVFINMKSDNNRLAQAIIASQFRDWINLIIKRTSV